MLEALLGDACWFSEIEAKTGQALAITTLEDQNPLLHGFRNQLQAGAGMLRTPTRFAGRSHLKALGLEERIEAICNISLNAARQANQVMGQDALICGVVGPALGEALDEALTRKAVGEPAIYLLDKGADCLQLEGFANLTQFRWGMECLKMINNVPVPLSGFLQVSGLPDLPTLNALARLAQDLELDLIGLELTLDQALALPPSLPDSCAWGFMLQAGGAQPLGKRQQALAQLTGYDPSLILGGLGLCTADWAALMQELRQLA